MTEIIIFISTIITVALLFSIINDPKGTEWKSILQSISNMNSDIRYLKQRREELLKDLGLQRVELTEQKRTIEELKFLISSIRDEMTVFRDQVAETREKQIQLRDILSNKLPVIKITGLPQQQTVEPGPKKSKTKLGRGINSLI